MDKGPVPKLLLDADGVAEALSCSRNKAYRVMSQLPLVRIGGARPSSSA
jgi:hypothetical protein